MRIWKDQLSSIASFDCDETESSSASRNEITVNLSTIRVKTVFIKMKQKAFGNSIVRARLTFTWVDAELSQIYLSCAKYLERE